MEIITKYSEKIKGILSTFDKMMFKGHLFSFFIKERRNYFLYREKVLIKDFPAYAEKRTLQIKENAKEIANKYGREYRHLDSWQCEYATDVMFKSREELRSVYANWAEHATLCFNCEDVMTFLGRKLHGNFQGEVVSDMKRRPQGIRIKHRMKKNFIKCTTNGVF